MEIINHSSFALIESIYVCTYIIAEFLGLPLSPPYLGVHSRYVSESGMNYASGSCGILSETGKTTVRSHPSPQLLLSSLDFGNIGNA